MTLLSKENGAALAAAAEMVKRSLGKKAGRELEIVIVALKGDEMRLAATVPIEIVRERLPHILDDCAEVA